MRRLIAIAALLVLFLDVGFQVSSAGAADNLQVIIDALDSNAAGSAQAAEDAFEAITANGQSDARAAYALALVRIRQANYPGAEQVLSGQPNPLPTERLRLWLALQLDQKDQAAMLYESLVKRLSDSNEPFAELDDTASLLGGIAALADFSDALVPSKYASNFRRSSQSTARRKAEIAEFVTRLNGIQPTPQQLQIQLQQLQTSRRELATAAAAFDTAVEANVTQSRTSKQQQEQAARTHKMIQIDLPKPTPGKPKKPSQPKLKTSKDADSADKKRAREKYEKALLEYPKKLAVYEEQYARWQAKDHSRRTQLAQDSAALLEQIKRLNAEKQSRGEEVTKLRNELLIKQRDVTHRQAELRLLQSLTDGDLAQSSQRVLRQPVHFELLSLDAEKQRLLRSLGK